MKIYIWPASPKNAYDVSIYRNAEDTRLHLNDCSLFSAEQTEKWLENLPKGSERYAVYADLEEGPHEISSALEGTSVAFVGFVRIDRIDETNRNLYIGLDLVQSVRGKGLTKLIYQWMLDYFFYHKNFNAAYLEVLETNEHAFSIYKKLGFKIDGLLPARVFRYGKYINVVHMSLLRDDWQVIKQMGGL